MRTGIGIVVGWLFAAGVLAGCGWLLTEKLQPLPAGFDWRSAFDLSDYVQAAPVAALAVICVAAGLASLVGAWPAARIARAHRGAAALTIAVPLMLVVIAGAALVPQPDWVPIIGMLLPIPLAVASWRMAIPRKEL